MIKKHLSDGTPEFFYNYETGAPFTHCLMCKKDLSTAENYAIEKVLKQNRNMDAPEIIYEYAICMDCAGGMQDEISEESLQSIKDLFEEHSFNALMKLEYLHSSDIYDMKAWTERCTFTGKETRLCSEFTVTGLFENGNLVYEHGPMVVSDDFMEMIQDVLSKKTRDYFDGFRDEYFDLPPDIKDIINSPTVGII